MKPEYKRIGKWLVLLVLCSLAGLAQADVFRPAYLEVRELGSERYDVLWKVPAQDGDTRLALNVVMPEGTETTTEPRSLFANNAITERWQVRRAGGLAEQTIRISGRATGVTDVIVRVQRQDGTSQTERLAIDKPAFIVKASTGRSELAWSYLVLGIEHILGGVDHLLFVLSLLLVVHGGKRIVATVTAFTVAHSITLVAATLGWVRVPGPPVEATIALSIVFVAAEVVRGLRGRAGLTAHAPWVVAFCFGLLHGFGFAGALAEVGLPQTAVPIALLMFNVGVELGQLLFVGSALALIALARRVSLPMPIWADYAMPYTIGSVAMFFFIDRVGAF
jgi:hydrogenase/urease accessory protein HupE